MWVDGRRLGLGEWVCVYVGGWVCGLMGDETVYGWVMCRCVCGCVMYRCVD